MRMKGRILNLCSALLVTAMSAFAQNMSTALVLERTDGTKAMFLLSDKPEISIIGDELTAKTSKEAVTVPIEDLLDYHFIKGQSGIEGVKVDEGFTLRDGMVRFTNLKAGGHVALYTLDGRTISIISVPGDGRVDLDLRTLEQGIIIIRTDNGSYKINNRL